jgi:phage terminase Nu1 subunit (DNA packaging protein)
MADDNGKQLYNSVVIGQLFDVSDRRIQQLTREGVIPVVKVGKDNRYELVATVRAYTKYLADKAYGREQDQKESELKEQKLRAEIALKESQGELHRLKTEIASGKYISLEEAKLDYQRFFVVFKKFAMSLPNRVVGLVGGYVDPVTSRALEKDMAKEVNDLLRSFVVAAHPQKEDGDEE